MSERHPSNRPASVTPLHSILTRHAELAALPQVWTINTYEYGTHYVVSIHASEQAACAAFDAHFDIAREGNVILESPDAPLDHMFCAEMGGDPASLVEFSLYVNNASIEDPEDIERACWMEQRPLEGPTQ